ncbi:hypothetical protein BJ508DRAFT_331180 [Ascobolus immersus RN42]|uniref:Uncharacterized protein n=1 Tax=Ascobolus immersus RN42 TaxID=1160509 RepID=A0A3N4HSY6_ASCIM|nr:hypothetical protein BJ508DRAFT_331180 [Ascobolus immersus RN42]
MRLTLPRRPQALPLLHRFQAPPPHYSPGFHPVPSHTLNPREAEAAHPRTTPAQTHPGLPSTSSTTPPGHPHAAPVKLSLNLSTRDERYRIDDAGDKEGYQPIMPRFAQ